MQRSLISLYIIDNANKIRFVSALIGQSNSNLNLVGQVLTLSYELNSSQI